MVMGKPGKPFVPEGMTAEEWETQRRMGWLIGGIGSGVRDLGESDAGEVIDSGQQIAAPRQIWLSSRVFDDQHAADILAGVADRREHEPAVRVTRGVDGGLQPSSASGKMAPAAELPPAQHLPTVSEPPRSAYEQGRALGESGVEPKFSEAYERGRAMALRALGKSNVEPKFSEAYERGRAMALRALGKSNVKPKFSEAYERGRAIVLHIKAEVHGEQ